MKYIYMLIKYIKSFLWRVVKRLSYTEEARRLKVKRSVKRDYSVYFFFSLISVYDCRTDEKLSHARSEILNAVTVKNTLHWEMTPRRLLEIH
jgi:hypothetical protein